MNHSILPVSIILAICIHGVIFFLVRAIIEIPEPDPKRSIPVTLRSADVQASRANTPTSQIQPQSSAARNTVTSRSSSTFSSTASNKTAKKTRQHTENQSTPSPKTSKPTIPTLPSFNTSQASRAQQARRGVKDMFEARSVEQFSEIKQISTEDLPPITDYELTLIQHMVKAELYDQFHPIMATAQKDTVTYVLKLNLFANGAIKKASISQSSGIKQIDELARRVAYNASPFPRPPQKDQERNYSYTIPITYEK